MAMTVAEMIEGLRNAGYPPEARVMVVTGPRADDVVRVEVCEHGNIVFLVPAEFSEWRRVAGPTEPR